MAAPVEQHRRPGPSPSSWSSRRSPGSSTSWRASSSSSIDTTEALRFNSASTPNELLWAGIFAIIIGSIYCLLAGALGRGSRGARLVFGILAVLNLAGGLYATVAYNGEQRAAGVVATVFSAIVLWLLYGTESDREFFAS